jgi:hypothetical protein
MAFGEMGRECRLNCSEIASSHGQADIHPIGMQGFEPAQPSPGFEDRFVFQEGHQKVLVIACQGDDASRPFATRKLLDHAHGTKTPVDIVAQENRHGMVERPSLHIGPDALGHLPEQVVTSMNIAHAVYPSSIRDTTRSRNRGRRFPKRLQERTRPPHGFGGPHVLGRLVSCADHKR